MISDFIVGARVLCTRDINKDPEPGVIKVVKTKYVYRVILDGGEEIETTTALMRLEEKS